jgi:ABC-type multidrug transport system fused ATPase/permease subunit
LKEKNIFAIAALAFLVLLLVVFNEFVFDNSKLMLNSDQLNGIGSRYIRAQHLILTEWDNSRLGGIPTMDATFSDVYHPLTLIYFVLDPDRATGFKFILTIWCAFIAAYILARYLTNKWQWAALLAFLYACSPQYFTYIYGGHDGKMIVFAAAPFAMYALMRLLREGSLKHGIYLSLSIVWMVLSSHLQLVYFFLWGAGLYALFELFSQKISAKIRITRLGLASLALAIALMISAFQIIPPYIYTTTDSVRGSAEKTTIEHSASWSLHGEELAAMILPGFLGTDVHRKADANSYWGQNPFKLNADGAGALLTFLALCGCLLPGNRRAALFWFSGCVIALSYAVGLHSFLFSVWFNFIPGVKNFRAPSMAIFWLPLAFLFLAAPVLKNFEENKKIIKQGAILYGILLTAILIFRFAWESLSGLPVAIFIALFGAYFIKIQNSLLPTPHSPLPKKEILRIILWAIPFLLLASFCLGPVNGAYFKPVDFAKAAELASFSISSFVISAIVLGAAFFAISNTSMNNIAKTALLFAVVAAVDLAMVNFPYIQNVDREIYYNPKNSIIQAIKKDSPNEMERPRIFSSTRYPAISGNNLASYKLRNALGFHDNEIATHRVFKEQLQNQAMLDIMNVGYIIFDSERGTNVQKNPDNLGYAKIYYKWESENDIINRLRDNEFDYRNILLVGNGSTVEARHALPPQNIDTQNIGTVKTTSSKMDEISFEIESSANGMLFISENYHKYWKAKVNGADTEISRAFSTFMAVDIPQGKSIVELQYKSESLRLSLWIGLAGLILLSGAVVICRTAKFQL